jgi:putative N6-adenine-specific DNA methylase
MERYFATCPRGLEQVLAAELAALGASGIEAVDGGAAFAGDRALCYAANLESRVASRVLWQVGQARYRNELDIFNAARALPWPRLFDVGHTIRVNVSAIRSPLRSLDFVTLRVKDAVCDVFREQRGSRPDVDTQAPDVRIHVFLTRDQTTFYLDTSGDALFKRGWRAAAGDAPLRENLAAGILRLTVGFRRPLFDPMCGNATRSGHDGARCGARARRSFGFERLAGSRGPVADGGKTRARATWTGHLGDKSGGVLGKAENLAAWTPRRGRAEADGCSTGTPSRRSWS